MTKSIIILLNLIGLIIFELFYGEVVSVKQEVPASLEVNIGDTVTINIQKGELTGFAKLQQDIPSGLEVEIIDSKSGTFSFKDNTLKIIWISLPIEESFSINYLITAVNPTQSTYMLDGKFSYIEQNERQSIDFSSSQIVIGKKQPNKITALEVEESKEKGKKEKKEKESKEIAEPKLVAEGDDFIAYRTIEKTEDLTKLRVLVTIDKEEINSFGKIEEYIPLGYIASEDNSNEGFFSYKNNTVKILWMALPFGETMTISYFIEKSELSDDVNKIKGKFSYLKDEETFEEDLSGTEIPKIKVLDIVPSEELAVLEEKEELESIVDQTSTDIENAVKESVVDVKKDVSETITKPVQEPVKKQNTTANTDKNTTEAITNIPSPEIGITYKVQIAAGKKEVDQNYFSKKHSINEKVAIEFHEGWRKYTIGQFPIYKEARDKRNKVWESDNKISDAFVTAYNQGSRITVQEALMISKQQWFK